MLKTTILLLVVVVGIALAFERGDGEHGGRPHPDVPSMRAFKECIKAKKEQQKATGERPSLDQIDAAIKECMGQVAGCSAARRSFNDNWGLF